MILELDHSRAAATIRFGYARTYPPQFALHCACNARRDVGHAIASVRLDATGVTYDRSRKIIPVLAVALFVAAPARAQDALVTHKSLSPELALDLARAALGECRKRGYQVAVAVVDRSGVTQVMLRDRFAGAHTPPRRQAKPGPLSSFRTNTTQLVASTQPGMPQAAVRNLPGVGCSRRRSHDRSARRAAGRGRRVGAPGGDADEACAKAGIEAVRDKLDF